MAEKLKCEKLEDLRKDTSRSDVYQRLLEAGPFYVARIERYFSDPQHAAQTGLDSTLYIDVHQLTITDFQHKLKLVVHPRLSSAIQKTELQEGSEVILKKCSLHFDETDLTGNSILVVHEWSVTKRKPEISLKDVSQIPWCPDSSNREKEDVPLSSSRGYFLDSWSSYEVAGDIWKKEGEIQTNPISFTPEDIYKIRDVAKKWNNLRSINPPLIVRVLSRCRLLHYAKPSKSDKWPFQAHFSVCDDTGVCTMVLWNALCPSYYYRLPEGSIILIRRFSVKRSFYSNNNTCLCNDNVEHFEIDLNLNSHHPISVIQILNPTAITWGLQLPSLKYSFVTRQQAGQLPDDYICDITGCVTYVGRYQRERVTNKHGEDSGGFWVVRWLHLHDNSSKTPFVIQLFKAAEADVSEDIKPGCVLVCRHMRVVTNCCQLYDSHVKREGYLTSTLTTKVHVVNANTPVHLTSQAAVKDVLDWMTSAHCQELISTCKLGGYFSYLTLPCRLPQLQQVYQDFKVTPSDKWTSEIEGLYYREHRRLFLQAVMLAVKLVPARKRLRQEQISPVRRSPRKPSPPVTPQKSPNKGTVPVEHEVIVDPDLYQSTTSQIKGSISHDQMNDSFPVHYSPDNWDHTRQWLTFTACCRSEDLHKQLLPHTDIPSHFIITWTGLNSRVALETLWNPRLDAIGDAKVTMKDFLCKGDHSTSVIPDETTEFINKLSTFMKTARDCLGQRFLLVVDCYRSCDQTELVLNTAYKI